MLNFQGLKIYRTILLTAIAMVLTSWHPSQSDKGAMATTNNFALDVGAIAKGNLAGDRDILDPTLVANLSLDRREIEFIEQLVFEGVNQ